MPARLTLTVVAAACWAALTVSCLAATAPAAEAGPKNSQTQAGELLEASGVAGGLVVHLGCGDGRLAAELCAGGRFTVHGIEVDADRARAARAHLVARGLHGPASVDTLAGGRLPYVDNLINLLVISDRSGVPDSELLRVLVPGGVAFAPKREAGSGELWKPTAGLGGGWSALRKPRPTDIDDWTHYLHGPDNNAVARDAVVGPPRRMQWTASPTWARHHDRMASMSALVSEGGRIFYIMDEGSRASVVLPPKWRLVARDAFNGGLLWKREIPDWHFHLWPMKGGPAQLPRRLVAQGGRVFVTLGLCAPVSELDAASGKTLRTFEETAGTEEIICSAGMLFALVDPRAGQAEPFVPDRSGVWNDTRRLAGIYAWDRHKERRIVAVDLRSGKPAWQVKDNVGPLTLAADDKRVYYNDGERLVALDRAKGRRLWRSEPVERRPLWGPAYAPTLVIRDGVVIFSGAGQLMTAASAESGQKIWTAPHPASGHLSPQDLLVAGGLVWSGDIANTRSSGVFTGRDLRTGKVVKEFGPDVRTYWFHHRCYRSKATERFLLPSRTGIEFVDMQAQTWNINHWVRGGCIYGIMPCNGLIYAPPHSCACYLESKVNGLTALAPAAAGGEAVGGSAGPRLQKGPAFGKVAPAEAGAAAPEDWPTYRHDSARSGAAGQEVAPRVKRGWQTELGGRLSSVVVAGGLCYVASVDSYTLHALSAATGTPRWHFAAGGRIDSPPTVSGSALWFGCADGYIYCLRASDGVLAWRFRAAPGERLVTDDGRLESAWPLHGSVLLRGGEIVAVAGRSMFLDGGLNLCRLNAASGELVSESRLDERNPADGKNLQASTVTLNMPVALPDVLASDGKYIYMRSQRFDLEGRRERATPAPTEPTQLARVQKGEDRHLFSPAGFTDGDWLHRSYWIYGRSYSSGCNWWAHAERFAPSGKLLVVGKDSVFGFGRSPEYHGKWAVPMEFHLFRCPRDPNVPGALAEGDRRHTHMYIERSANLLPAGRQLTLGIWVKAAGEDGVLISYGGPAEGYALALVKGKPAFMIRRKKELFSAAGKESILGRWVHLAAVLSDRKVIELYVDGQKAAETPVPGPLTANPEEETLFVGMDGGAPVGDYERPGYFTGQIDELRMYRRALSAEEVRALAAEAKPSPGGKGLVLRYDFEKGAPLDVSGGGNNGYSYALPGEGRFGRGMTFEGAPGGGAASTRGWGGIPYDWSVKFPIQIRAMVLTGKTLFAAGPEDVLDEEEAYKRPHDPDVRKKLAEQDAILAGSRGAKLFAVSAESGKSLAEVKLDALPVWDGLVAAGGKLFMAGADGKVTCWEAEGGNNR